MKHRFFQTQNRKAIFCKSRKKLRSKEGASILLTMLLFLVTSVLCLVLLTAATTASGVLSGMSEDDQHYYAVTSARQVLEAQVAEIPLTFVKVTTQDTVTTYTDTAESKSVGAPSVKTYILEGKRAGEVLDHADTYCTASNLVSADKTTASILRNAAYTRYTGALIPAEGSAAKRVLEITPTMKTGDLADAAVNAEERLDASGKLTFLVSDTTAHPYTQMIAFQLEEVSEQRTFHTQESPVVADDGTTHRKTSTATTYEAVTYLWHVSDLHNQ